jgi:hypothetical protein
MTLLARFRRLDAPQAPDTEPAVDPASARNAARPRWRRVLGPVGSAFAGLLVVFALLVPNHIGGLGPAAFLRIPVEALLLAALVLVLPPRARRVVAAVVGVILGVLTVLKFLDMGFYEVLARPFDPVLDWPLLAGFVEFLKRSFGRAGAAGFEIAAVLIAVGLVVLLVLSVQRLTRLAVGHRTATTRTVVALGIAWIICAVLGAQAFPGVPLASDSAAVTAYERALQLPASVRDRGDLAAQAKIDAFRNTPDDRLLTALRGKDVMLTFVESYGRVAIEDPQLGPQLAPLLDDANRRLRAAGFQSRSAYLTSPTFGGGSWFAHSTLLSGLWIDNQQRYHDLVTSDRFTLSRAFRRAGWRTVCVQPATVGAWPEGTFYSFNRVYEAADLNYHGPRFNFSSIPDQYTLSALKRAEFASPSHTPTMTEIVLLSSHGPWQPLPHMVDWNAVGDGSIYLAQSNASDVPRSTAGLRAAYIQSIEYSLSALLSYVELYGTDNLVLVFLGDHQPAAAVTGDNASHDVPITILAHDPAVLDRVAGWGWQDGLRPSPQAPVWRMDTFRDHFLTTFGSGG